MLRSLAYTRSDDQKDVYPFNVPVIASLGKLEFKSKVVFFVGENGTGKSTLLEGIAVQAGLNAEGGSKNFIHKSSESASNPAYELAKHLRLSWDRKYPSGYFFRAESFFTLASELERIQRETPQQDAFAPYGGTSLHAMSHGQSFFALFGNRLTKEGFYLFDEPEAALSPQKQLSFLAWLHECVTKTDGQCIIATHSPIILSYPNAQIFSFDGDDIREISYKETSHYTITKDFLDNPEVFLRHLLQ